MVRVGNPAFDRRTLNPCERRRGEWVLAVGFDVRLQLIRNRAGVKCNALMAGKAIFPPDKTYKLSRIRRCGVALWVQRLQGVERLGGGKGF